MSIIRAWRRFASKLTGKKTVLFFLFVVLVCIIAVCIGIYTQFFYKYAETDPLMIGINIGSQKTAEELANLEANFNSIFQNKVNIKSENVNVEKIKEENDLVYSLYKLENEDENYYTIKAVKPTINIKTDKVEKAALEYSGRDSGKPENSSKLWRTVFIWWGAGFWPADGGRTAGNRIVWWTGARDGRNEV